MNSQTNSFILAPCWYWIPGEVIAIAMKSQADNSVLVLDHSHEMALKILKLALSSRARSFLQGSQFVPVLCFVSHWNKLLGLEIWSSLRIWNLHETIIFITSSSTAPFQGYVYSVKLMEYVAHKLYTFEISILILLWLQNLYYFIAIYIVYIWVICSL